MLSDDRSVELLLLLLLLECMREHLHCLAGFPLLS